MEYRPIADWLRKAREAQIDPATGEAWTQKHFLEVLKAETKWALHGPNYSLYESGKQTPKPPTLKKFVDFWAAHGVAGPDMTPPSAPVEATQGGDATSLALGSIAVQLAALVEEMKAQRVSDREEIAALKAQVLELQAADDDKEVRLRFLEAHSRDAHNPGAAEGFPERSVPRVTAQ